MNARSPFPAGGQLGDILHVQHGRPLSFRAFHDLGYKLPVPVIPPEAPLSPTSSISKMPSARGKAVGVRGHDGLWCGLRWSGLIATSADLDRWTDMGASVGIRTGEQPDGTHLVAIDADTLDPHSASVIGDSMRQHFGVVACRVGRAPKALYIVRCSGSVAYTALKFGKGPLGRPEMVELLTAGRQFVAAGVHPVTMRPYEWREAPRRYSGLPIVAPEQITAFLASLVPLLPDAALPETKQRAHHGAVDQAALRGSLDEVKALVAQIRNEGPAFADRSAYVRVGYAIKAALPDDPDEARALFFSWALSWDGNSEPDKIEADWRSFIPPFHAGIIRLRFLASQSQRGTLGKKWWTAETESRPSPETASAWPDPIDIFSHADPMELGTPPAGSLPETIRAVAVDESRRKGVPVAFAAAAAVGTIGAAIGAGLRIRPRLKDGEWTEPASLWITLVAPPGSAKSPTIKALLKPLSAVDAAWGRQDAPHHAEWDKKRAAHGRRKNAPEPGQEPPLRRAIVDDVTPESLVRILARNPRGVMRVTDELFAFLGSFGAYKRTGDGERSMALTLHDGGYIRVDRVGSGSLTAENALMGVLASTQPDKIQAKTRELSDDGLLQRFLFVLHDGVDRRGADVEPDAHAAAEYGAVVRAMSDLKPGKTVTLTPEARGVLEAAERKIADLAHIPGASSAWAGHISKWGMFLPRLVLIFSAVRDFEDHGIAGLATPVNAETAEMAVRFAWFLLRHGLQFYTDFFGPSVAASDAKWIAGWLLTRTPTDSVTPRDVYQARHDFRGPEGRSAMLKAMGELERCGWVSVADRKPDEGPTKWTINPKIHQHFVQHAAREKVRREHEREKIEKAISARGSLTGNR